MNAHRSILSVLAITLGAMAFMAVPALAAAPEAPVLTVEHPVPATSASFDGVLYPNAPEGTLAPEGTYKFLYKQGSECKGGSETTPGLSLGLADEALPGEQVTGLTPNTEYAVCLSVTNPEGTAVSSPPVIFTTALPPETPEAGKAEPITSTTATLHGTLNPHAAGNPGTYEFIYRESPTACQGEGETPVGQAPMTGTEGQAATPTALTGLLPNATYSFCLLARNEAGETAISPPVAFTTAAVEATIVPGSEAATNLTTTSADLTAQVNPNGSEVTTCEFEYGASVSYGNTVSCAQAAAQIGSGRVSVTVSQHVTGLEANTTYHWRLVARNAAGTSTSIDHTFVYSTAGAELPDHRAYEMVTPPFKDGAKIGAVSFSVPPHITEDGSRVIATSVQCFAGAESCTGFRGDTGEPYEFTRTPAGWVTTPLAPPQALTSPQQGNNANTSWAFGEDTALFSAASGPAQEDEWYARTSGGSFLRIGPVTSPGESGITSFFTSPILATADLSHLVWAMYSPFWSFDATKLGRSAYEYVGTGNKQPFLVSVTGGLGSDKLITECAAEINSLSADGRTVYFTAEGQDTQACGIEAEIVHVSAPLVSELYARVDGETSEAHTVKISPGKGAFQGTSVDGSKAFFTEGGSLYESECFTQCETLGEQRRLTDVSGGSPEPKVQGVEALSADGSHVYFVASGVLTAKERPGCKAEFEADRVAEEGRCQAKDGANNLYVYERDASHPEGYTAFIAPVLGPANVSSGAGQVNVTPDGRFLVFGDTGDLTADDTSTNGVQQIFRYDAETEQLVRISIGDDGFNDNGNTGTIEANASIVPAGFGGSTGLIGSRREDPTMSNDGSYVFFDSPVALTPHALNDVVIRRLILEGVLNSTEYALNVYEYHEGHVYLISDGHDASSSSTNCGFSSVCLLGTDATGHNVFFTTSDRLVPADTDTQLDIYDARVCEPENGDPCIQPAPAATPPCLGEACHGIPAATPSLLAPGSATFNGAGDKAPEPSPKKVTKKKVVKCKRGFVKNKHGKCVKKKKAKKLAKRASNDRRASR